MGASLALLSELLFSFKPLCWSGRGVAFIKVGPAGKRCTDSRERESPLLVKRPAERVGVTVSLQYQARSLFQGTSLGPPCPKTARGCPQSPLPLSGC